MELKSQLCLLLVVLCATQALSSRHKRTEQDNPEKRGYGHKRGYHETTGPHDACAWKKINSGPVYFEGGGDKPGVLTYSGKSTLVSAMKLVYKSGLIRCAVEEAYNSRWGCANHPAKGIANHPLNVIITDGNKKRVYPLDKYLTTGNYSPGLWYYLPFTDPLHSDELVFSNYLDPFYLPKGGKLQVWFGEDLMNWHDTDNPGMICVDVFIQHLC